MYARVASWEGADAETLNRTAAEIRTRTEEEGGPPEGLPAKGFLLLNDTEGGRSIGITLFETEDDYRRGDAALDAMPAGDTPGSRTGVTKYDVAIRMAAQRQT